MTTNSTQNDDMPTHDATTGESPLDAPEALGEFTILGGPRSLEDEALLDAPDTLEAEAGFVAPNDVPQADQSADIQTDVTLPTLDETLEHEAASNPELALDEEILTSLDLMEQDTSATDSELVLEDILEGTDEFDLVEAALLDDAPASDLEGDLVALVREQQAMLITAERRIAELEAALASRLSAEDEQALRDEVTSYKTLLDSGGKAKKPKDGKKGKKDDKDDKDDKDADKDDNDDKADKDDNDEKKDKGDNDEKKDKKDKKGKKKKDKDDE